uniref:ATP-binding cassette domain-containing protein n=1 Tax=Enterocloster hominis (ex Hitch et al. 2024) TaxID=1917870 RepID=UPI00103099AD|nr:ATP-binding cassette domain-containing protein [Lachnoclostridium pacaense]
MDKFVVRMTNVCAGPFPESHMDFEAASGEITAIIGSNGEGKTTLAKVLAGMIPRISGDIWLDDRKLDIHSISSAHRNGIYLMTESLQLYPGKSIMDNLLLGIEQLIFHNRLFNPPREKKEAVCRQVLKELGLDLDLGQSVDHLSQGEKCLLQIGRILLCRPSILIMDEFSASLTVLETKRIMSLLTGLKQKNICIILISHEYSTVIRYCDRISLVEQGRIAESYSRAELGDEAFVRRVLTFKKNFSYPKLPRTPGQPLLTASHISSGIIKDVSFTLQEGEILGIAGVVGSGRTTLINAIMKERPITSGRLVYAPALDRAGAVSILPGDCGDRSLFSGKDLTFNITSSNVQKAARFYMISGHTLDLYARDYMDRLSIRKPSCRVPVDQLSQGEMQKVLIARSLYQDAKLYIFDEPSSNLDLTSKSELYNIYNALLARGASIILISSDFSELIGMCDRILLLKAGEQVGLYPADEITNDFLYSVL